MSESSRLTTVEYAVAFGVAIVWGLNNACAKLATGVLPPLLVGALRFAIALVVLLPFLLRGPIPKSKNLYLIAICCGPVHFSLLYLSFWMAHDLSPLSVSLQLWIPFAALLSWLILKEPPTKGVLVGLLVAFVGVAVMAADPHVLREWPALLVSACASLAWAFGTITARQTPSVHPLKMQGLAAVFAAPVMGLGSFVFERTRWGALAHADWTIWAAILFSSFASTVAATALMFWLVQRREPSRVTPYMLTSPIVSCFIGVAAFGDMLTPQIVIGAAASIGGVGIVALTERGLKRRTGGSTTAEAALEAEAP
ncbi:MAG TPA: DMT family transporter [Caulobacteraceae bacterium]|jgi:O-acetylserine/cysteine efflux transporter|nr:DMT family transporter [Caulobacteraceae bacterium]